MSNESLAELRVEPGLVTLFARALGHLDASPLPDGSEGVPVTFPVAHVHFDPAYELRPSPDRPWFGSGQGPGFPRPSSGEGTRLHAEQHFEYRRPLRVGERLSVRRVPGDTWEKQSSKGGTLRFIENLTEYTDESGEIVVVARAVSVIVPGREGDDG